MTKIKFAWCTWNDSLNVYNKNSCTWLCILVSAMVQFRNKMKGPDEVWVILWDKDISKEENWILVFSTDLVKWFCKIWKMRVEFPSSFWSTSMTTLTGREFIAFTKSNWLFYYLDFPKSKDGLIKLLVKFNRNHGTKVSDEI